MRQLVTRIDKRQFSVAVCSLQPTGRIGEQIAQAGVPVISLDMASKPRVFEILRGSIELSRVLERLDIDLVQSLLYRANATTVLAAGLSRGSPVVVAGQRSLGPMTGQMPTWITRFSHRKSHKVVAVSNQVKARLISSSGLSDKKVVVIDNGVDTTRFRPDASSNLRRELELSDNTILVGAAGRLSPKKGFSGLLSALAVARSQGVDLHAAIVGEGPEQDALEAQIERESLQDAVTLLGYRTDMEGLYPAFDIFVLPSLEEGSPNALLEAMAAGCASVANSVGGVVDIIQEGTNGLLATPGDLDSIATAIVRLATDNRFRRDLQKAARERILCKFDISDRVDRYQQLYSSLLESERDQP